jgi:phospholipid transport system substrate-binding protein
MTMILSRLIAPALFAILFVFPSSSPAASPRTEVKATVDQVIATLKDETLSAAARREKLTSIIRPRFDFRIMSRSVLGVNWRRATETQKRRFIGLFSELLKSTYVSKIEQYTNERVNYGEERIEDDRALVETMLVTQSTEIPIIYRMIRKDGEWKVYDVVIENVSLVRNYRSTYDEIARKEGIDRLLQRMEEKLTELRSGSDTAGEDL